MTEFKYVSLFSGIGGFETALNKLGGTCVLASEIDRFANQSYEALYGHATAGDITKIEAADVPDHDLLVGGFPCQAFSVAGKRGGFDDARGTLFFEVARLAKTKQPRMLLLENVKGLISHDDGKTLDTIVQTLNDIGYHVDFNVLNSKYFGVPQNRERIFIVAFRDDIAKPSDWIIEGTNVVAKGKRRIAAYDGIKTFNFEWPSQTEVNTQLRDILETEVDDKYYLSDEKIGGLIQRHNVSMDSIESITQSALDASYYKGIGVRGNKLRCCFEVPIERGGIAVREATKQGYAIAMEGDAVNFQFPDSKTRRGRVGKQMANTLEASNINQGVVEESLALTERRTEESKRIRREYREKYGVDFSPRRGKEIVPRIDNIGNCVTATQSIEQQIIELPHYRIRKLTPLECFRLQSFSDAQHQAVVDAGLSDSQRYKQAGNAVTVNVIHAIGERLLPYLDK